MLFVDSHVHVYDCYDLDVLLHSAHANLEAAARRLAPEVANDYLLVVTEGRREGWLERAMARLGNGGAPTPQDRPGDWLLELEAGGQAIRARKQDEPDSVLHLVAGRQVETREKIEVLALCCRDRLGDGESLNTTVRTISAAGGIVVLPWGFGKWWGTRGRQVGRFLDSPEGRTCYLGDNGGRPRLSLSPPLFRRAAEKGIAVLPGSDPLPLPGEAGRVGGYGFAVTPRLDAAAGPVGQLRDSLAGGECQPLPFGGLQTPWQFVCNQLRLRLARN